VTSNVGGDSIDGFRWEYSGCGKVMASARQVNAPGTGAGAIKGNFVTVPNGGVILALCRDTTSNSTISSPTGIQRNVASDLASTEWTTDGTEFQPSFTTTVAGNLFVVVQFMLFPSPIVPPIPSSWIRL
jgi:hypothetical protein